MKETNNSFIHYEENIVFVRLKEDVDVTVESLVEQHAVQESLVGHERYGVLVDATLNSSASQEAREYMARYNPENRRATAIVTNNNLAANMIVNFYLRINKPRHPAKMFRSESEALIWLKEMVNKPK